MKHHKKKYKYEKRFVLYIDLLGFKKKIESGSAQAIGEILDDINSAAKRIAEGYQGISFSQFSDTIILSSKEINFSRKVGEFSLEVNFFEIVRSLQDAVFVQQKIPFRGAIVYGDVYHDSDQFFGPAINIAYDLAEKEAIYPRVLIHPDAITKAEIPSKIVKNFLNRGEDLKISWETYIGRDFDGYFYTKKKNNEWHTGEENIISDELSENKANSKIFAKYAYLAQEYNKKIDEFQAICSEEFLKKQNRNKIDIPTRKE